MPRCFPKPIRRAALQRAGGRCEGSGALYGLPAGQRCNADLGYGVEFDHILAASNGGDTTLENCAAVCPRCHRYKTAQHDTPRAAKIVRQRDKARGIRKASRPIPGSKASGWRKRMDGTVERRA